MKIQKILSVLALVSMTAPMVLAVDVDQRVPDGGATFGLVAASLFALGVTRKMLARKK